MPFEYIHTKINDVILIKPKKFVDSRGFFMELYKKCDFKKSGINLNFVQANYSKSEKNVIRGLHYQLFPKAQGKLVKCIKGKIFDVAVDIRKNSSTFKKWIGYELSEENNFMLWIPEGFAHGFLTLSDTAEVIYFVSGSEYSPEYEYGIIWNDIDLNINWKIKNPLVSKKDSNWPELKKAKIF